MPVYGSFEDAVLLIIYFHHCRHYKNEKKASAKHARCAGCRKTNIISQVIDINCLKRSIICEVSSTHTNMNENRHACILYFICQNRNYTTVFSLNFNTNYQCVLLMFC